MIKLPLVGLFFAFAISGPAAHATGFYTHGSGPGKGSCMSTLGAVSVGAALVSTTCDNRPHQNFVLHNTNDFTNSFTIQPSSDNTLCAENDGSSVTLQPCSGAYNQMWLTEGSNFFSFLPTEGCLDVLGDGLGDNVPLDVTRCNGTLAQSFWPRGFAVQLEAANSSFCMSWAGSFELAACDSPSSLGPAQTWELRPNMTIFNPAANACVATDTSGNLAMGTCAPNAGNVWNIGQQQWNSFPSYAYLASTHTYISNLPACLDVLGANDSNNQPVDTHMCGGPMFGNNLNDAQLWQLVFPNQ